MFCINCGKELSDNADYCISCGTSVKNNQENKVVADKVFCKNCGKAINSNAAVCLSCGVEKGKGGSFCANCGSAVSENAAVCLSCGAAVKKTGAASWDEKDKTIAGLLALFLGGLGIHHFYLRENKKGILKLLLCWTYIPAIIALIDAIRIFTNKYEINPNKFI